MTKESTEAFFSSDQKDSAKGGHFDATKKAPKTRAPAPDMSVLDMYGDLEATLKEAGFHVADHDRHKLILDGQIHSMDAVDGKKGDQPLRIKGGVDGYPAAAFWDWRGHAQSGTWRYQGGSPLSNDQIRLIQEDIERKKAEKREKDRINAQKAAEYVAGLPGATDAGYLKRKGVQAFNAKQDGDNLVVPYVDIDTGEVRTYETITPDGTKLFQSGGSRANTCAVVGMPDQPNRVFIAEGFADAATLAEYDSDALTASAGGVHNFTSVARALRSQYPNVEIIIVADISENGEPLKAAKKAGKIADADVYQPSVGDLAGISDINDLHAAVGIDRVDMVLVESNKPEAPADITPTAIAKDGNPLLDMPGLLGEIHRFVLGAQTERQEDMAGLASLAIMSMLVQGRYTIDSYSGLGFNEQYIAIGSTTSGKEAPRKAIRKIRKRVSEAVQGYSGITLPAVLGHLPASMQGLHEDLENEAGNVMYLPDEVGDHLQTAKRDENKKSMLSYVKEIYTSALDTIKPPNSSTTKRAPVECPRMSMYAATTPMSMVKAMSGANAESGQYNRYIMMMSDKEGVPVYDDFIGEPSIDLINRLSDLVMGGCKMTFTRSAWETFKHMDYNYARPEKARMDALAGRLSEQAIKIAGLSALAKDINATEIDKDDIEFGYRVRFWLYQSVSTFLINEGALSDESETSKMYRKCAEALKKHKRMTPSQFTKNIRGWSALSVSDQCTVQRQLLNNGIAEKDGKAYAYISDG